jgi:hypothetical protein
VLVACWCLDDEDRREALRDEERALHAAFLTSKAMWDGKALAADARAFHAKLTIPPAGQSLESAALRDALTQLDTAGRTTLAGD